MVAMNSPESGRFKRSLPVYKFALAGFIVFLAMSLLAVVDFRRGFILGICAVTLLGLPSCAADHSRNRGGRDVCLLQNCATV